MTLAPRAGAAWLLWLLLGLALPGGAWAASAVLIWPIDPVIESDQRATPLWLENRGADPVLLQIRVFGWYQEHGENQYRNQADIVASPPVARIEPGQKQLVRLTRTADVMAGREQAYRILIDEIPTGEADAQTVNGIRFQMRYSVPLFSYGQGLWLKPDPHRRRDPATAGQPRLDWRIVREEGRRYLEVGNQGTVHARLTEVSLQTPRGPLTLGAGLLGCVLPGSRMRWPVPESAADAASLQATVNGSRQVVQKP